MSFSLCPNCNQLYFPHESHICNHADSLPSERSALNCNFQIPIQEEVNVQEMSLSKECHDPREIFLSNIDNVSNAFSREDSVLHDQSTLHTNPADKSDGPVPTLPSFQSTFNNNRLWKVNQEIPLSPPDRTYEMSNPGESIPFVYGPASDTFTPDESQDNSGESNNCLKFIDRSSNIQPAKLLKKASEVSNQEGLPEVISFAFQPREEIETGDTKTRDISENFLDKEREIAVPTHSRLKKHICLVCGKEFQYKSALERHSVVHSGIKPFNCDICKKDFTRKSDLRDISLTAQELLVLRMYLPLQALRAPKPFNSDI